MKIDFDIVFKHLAKWDKDTYVFCVIAISTFVALAAQSPPIATIFTGCAFILLYIGWRYSLASIQAKEQEASFKRSAPRRARQIADANVKPSDQIPLENPKKSANTRRNVK